MVDKPAIVIETNLDSAKHHIQRQSLVCIELSGLSEVQEQITLQQMNRGRGYEVRAPQFSS
jgi:hypothetical protein